MKFHDMDFEFFLPKSLDFFVKNNSILDIASCWGESSICLSERGAKDVLGIEPRIDNINKAENNLRITNLTNILFKQGSAVDIPNLKIWLNNIDTVTTFGMLYHLADHNMVFKTICESSAKHLLFETEYGPETNLPSISWYVESTEIPLTGYHEYSTILAGAPNLEWFKQTLGIYGWQIVYYRSFLSDWEMKLSSPSTGTKQRMIIGAINLKHINVTNLPKIPSDMWEWSIEPNKIIAKEFNTYEVSIRH